MRAKLLVPVIVTAGVIGIAPTAALAGPTTTLHLVSTQTSQVQTPHGFSFTEVIRDTSGKKVGNDLVSCIAVKKSANCSAFLALDTGTLYATFVLGDSQTVHGKVVGGTGAYKGATGTLTAVSGKKTTKITITYQT